MSIVGLYKQVNYLILSNLKPLLGTLLDCISGHEGPITCLSFSPADNYLASGSWDKTVRVHDMFNNKNQGEIFTHNSEVTDVKYRPDGK